MKKLFFLSLGSLLLLSACSGKEVETEVTIESVDLSENVDLDFSFYLSGPEKLAPYFVKISGVEDRNPDSGTMCIDTGILLNCEVGLQEYEQPYLVKITYENGDYSLTEVTVPIPEFMEIPQIVAPVRAPDQGSPFELSFKDIGADSYEVRVATCNEYANDGINPCLNDDEYTILMGTGQPEILFYDWESEYSLEPSANISDGTITVKSNFELTFEDQVEYSVKAQQQTELGFTWVSDAIAFTR